ncbi:g2698 [Coccomyxa elongata]
MALPLKGRALKKMYDHPLLSFYTLLAPARNEYRMLRIVDAAPKSRGSKEENFYVKGEQSDELILHRYKTAKHYGSAKVPVPPDLRKAVQPRAATPGIRVCEFRQAEHALDDAIHEQPNGCRAAGQEARQCAAAQDRHHVHGVRQAREGQQGGAREGDAPQAGDQRAFLQRPRQGSSREEDDMFNLTSS